MKKICLFILSFTLVASLAFANDGGTIAVTPSESETVIQGRHLLLVNDGPDEAFIEVTANGETVLTATTSSFELKLNESVTLDSDRGYSRISAIATAAESATLRFLVWD